MKPTAAELEQYGEECFEEKVLNFIFSYFDIARAYKFAMLDRTKASTGRTRLTFAEFDEVFPEFPLYLRTRKFRSIDKHMTVAKMFSNFERSPPMQAYLDLVEHLPARLHEFKRSGLVFNWPGLKGAIVKAGDKEKKKATVREPGGSIGMVLHNAYPVKVPNGLYMEWTAPKRLVPLIGATLCLQPLSSFIRELDRDWIAS